MIARDCSCVFFVTRNLLESSLMCFSCYSIYIYIYIYIKAEPSSIARILMSFKAEKEGQCMLSLFLYRLTYRVVRDNETKFVYRINCNQTITTDSCLLTFSFSSVVMIYKSNFSARFFLNRNIFFIYRLCMPNKAFFLLIMTTITKRKLIIRYLYMNKTFFFLFLLFLIF